MGSPLIAHSDDPNTAGVLGEGPTGVYGNNTLGVGNGMIGYSDKGRGVWGHSNQNGIGVLGESKDAQGVMGKSQTAMGVLGEGLTGVYGNNTLGVGNGMIGYSDKGRGIWGHSNETGIGVLGESKDGQGVMGNSQTSYGVLAHSIKWAGIRGSSDENRGVEGWAKGAEGVFGTSETGNAVWGQTEGNGIGVLGTSKGGIGVSGKGGHLAGFFDGDVEVTGDLRLTNADCAEEFDMAETRTVDPGTVMVLDAGGALAASSRAYDKCVVGVISGAGVYRPAIVLDRQPHPLGKRQPLALVGKVFCKVDADFGAVAVGDLLTTSATPGHAMAALDPAKAFGAVIGKALQPLREGRGLIPILVALQ